MSSFTDKTVIVTGAAGDIGSAAVLRLTEAGAKVLAVDVDGAALAAAVDGVARAQAHVADVSDAAAVADYVAAARDMGSGRIDGFFNNAGIEGPVAPITEYPDDDFDRVFAVNIRGAFLGLKAVAPHMPSGGAIVNTASTGGVVGFPGGGAYVLSKHAVVGLTRVAAIDLAAQGIRVNAICPGPVEGRMTKSLEDQIGIAGVLISAVPLGRFAQPDEIASLAVFLLSDEASYISGGVYPVDGAQTAL